MDKWSASQLSPPPGYAGEKGDLSPSSTKNETCQRADELHASQRPTYKPTEQVGLSGLGRHSTKGKDTPIITFIPHVSLISWQSLHQIACGTYWMIDWDWEGTHQSHYNPFMHRSSFDTFMTFSFYQQVLC